VSIHEEIQQAIKAKDCGTVKRLITAHPYVVHFRDTSGWPLIHRCIADPVNLTCLDLDLAKLFVERGGDLSTRTPEGFSLLFLATVHSKSKPIADFLVSCGMRLTSFESAIATILKGDDKPKVVSAILKKEPQLIFQRGRNGYTLLHYAIRAYNPPLVQVLLKHGADANCVTFDGRSPLGLCSQVSDTELQMRKLLLAAGAKYTAREEIVEMLSEARDNEVIERFDAKPSLMHAWVYPVGPFLHFAAIEARTEVVQYLLDRMVDVNEPNQEGETALHQVMRRDSIEDEPVEATVEMIKILLKHGADINRSDARGFTPLHRAVGDNQEKAAILLVENKANINAKTNNGMTPLDVVYEQRYLGYGTFARYLRSKGAVRGKKR
jgi:hypothetical protein